MQALDFRLVHPWSVERIAQLDALQAEIGGIVHIVRRYDARPLFIRENTAVLGRFRGPPVIGDVGENLSGSVIVRSVILQIGQSLALPGKQHAEIESFIGGRNVEGIQQVRPGPPQKDHITGRDVVVPVLILNQQVARTDADMEGRRGHAWFQYIVPLRIRDAWIAVVLPCKIIHLIQPDAFVSEAGACRVSDSGADVSSGIVPLLAGRPEVLDGILDI